MVHDLSPRFDAPFVAVNLAAIPEGLVESELFGHEKGAFTGAVRRRAGRFEEAEGGTIFLDEVGDAPPAVQVRLLRVLQERELTRVGGTGTVKVNVRVVAATNQELERLVEDRALPRGPLLPAGGLPGAPAAAARAARRPEAAGRALPGPARRADEPPPARGAGRLLARLEAHDWPGNVRELENYVQRALILSPGAALELPGPPGGDGLSAPRPSRRR